MGSHVDRGTTRILYLIVMGDNRQFCISCGDLHNYFKYLTYKVVFQKLHLSNVLTSSARSCDSMSKLSKMFKDKL